MPETQALPAELDAVAAAAVAWFKDAMAGRRWQRVASNGRERTLELELLLMHHKMSLWVPGLVQIDLQEAIVLQLSHWLFT